MEPVNPVSSSSSRPSDLERPNKRPRLEPDPIHADANPGDVQAGPAPAQVVQAAAPAAPFPIPIPILVGSALVLHSIYLGRCLSHSFVMDPRHLEAYAYGFWAMLLFGYASSRQVNVIRLVQTQFPIWSSPRDMATRTLLNNGGVSAATQPDGTARGVFVDLAVVIPITEPRKTLKRRTNGLWPTANLAGKSLDWFYTNVVAKVPALEPTFVRVVGLKAPLLVELKRGPPRHASSLFSFYWRLWQLLKVAKRQAEKQAVALFGSWRYRRQDRVFIVAGSGDYFAVAQPVRAWANLRDIPANSPVDSGDAASDGQVEAADDESDSDDISDDASASTPSSIGTKSRRDRYHAQRSLLAYENCRPADIQANMAQIDILCEGLEAESEPEDGYDEYGAAIDATHHEVEVLRRKAKTQEANFNKAAQALSAFASGSNRRSARPGPQSNSTQQQTNLENKRDDAEVGFGQAARSFALVVKPVLNDTLGPFRTDDVELYHRSEAGLDSSFYETRSPQELFNDLAQPDGPVL
ncbi:hypothetical protein HMN09_01145300 [Mycena chlorophos]|uniref:Uncharacterized protein n=1 Tax=Mycena chlorophos TaxID=658473 RepID=A0A8H6S784_MYCCL|nr:hypothetical protein HMN09_01145300 [Mycena chlorophos]